MKVAVVGVGLIGCSIGLAARQRLGAHVVGYDPSAGALEAAIARGAIVESLSLAAAAAGADGIIVEVHPNPEEAICDGPQALQADGFAAYAEKVQQAAAIAGKVLSPA